MQVVAKWPPLGGGVNVYFVVMASLIQNTFSAGIRTKNECVQEAKSNIGQEIPNVQPADTFKLGRDCQAYNFSKCSIVGL